jgi:hypothetical protein
MKIGVFGDSFADKTCRDIWWQYLENIYGHDVTCFGEGGSSLSFSVDLIDYYHDQFDYLIWCATSVNRISFWYKDIAYHNTGTFKPLLTGNTVLDNKRSIIHQYLTEVFDCHFQEILGHALIHFMLQKYPKLIVIPCFSTPVYFMQHHGFNLYKLCEMETECFFPTHDTFSIINSDQDQRQGHLTVTNQKILAQLIQEDLMANTVSHIFSTSYDNFVFDKSLFSEFNGK